MNIAIVGTGYVGLVTGTCFAEIGVDVTCIDIDKDKIDNLNKGIMPIYEPGLEEIVRRNKQAGRLHFETDLASCLNNVDVIFNAVGTPSDEDGSADLSYVLNVAHTIGRMMTKHIIVVTKSTVPVGTTLKVKSTIQEELDARGSSLTFDVVSNPEFLKEGAAIKDFMSPDRVVIGVESDYARDIMERLYKPFMLSNYRILFMDVRSAEMTKYAANAMLATRISFMNDIANLCEFTGADVNEVRKGIGADSRIGNKFMYPGCGYGGSCFPKDVKALIHTGREYGYKMRVIEAVEEVNDRQKEVVFNKLQAGLGDLRGKTVAIWGLSFKPETDDMRDASSIIVIKSLIAAGANVNVYDPIAMSETKRILGDLVTYANDMYEATLDADAIALITEWKQFRAPNWKILKKTMKGNYIVDGRNQYDSSELHELGFTYSGIGRS